MREVSELDYFGVDFRRNWSGCSERGSGSGADVGGGKRVIALHPSLVVGVALFASGHSHLRVICW